MLQDVTPHSLVEMVRPLCPATEHLLKPVGTGLFDRLFLNMYDDWTWSVDVRRQVQKDGAVSFDEYPSGQARKWVELVPEKKWDVGSRAWMMAATDLNALLILASWHRGQIVASPTAELTLDSLALRFISQFGYSAVPQAEFRAVKTLPEYDTATERFVEARAADYQQLSAYCCANSGDGFALFMDTGTGKTFSAIETAVLLWHKMRDELVVTLPDGSQKRRPLRVMVVCPKQLNNNWGREIDRFSRLSFKFINCRGGRIDRAKHVIDLMCADGVDVAVMAISYGTAKNSVGTLTTVKWDLIIADESQNFKSHRTQTWTAMEKLRDASTRRAPLTATPIANTLNDLWTQLEFCGKGYSGFHAFEAFRSFYGVYQSVNPNGSGVGRLVGFQNVPLLQERLTRTSYMISIEEACPNLPPVVYDTYDVELTEAQREAYEQLKTTLRYEIEDTLNDGMDNLSVTMNNVLTMLLRLAHVASGFITFDELWDEFGENKVREKRVDRFDPNAKLEALVELIKSHERPQNKVIIWCQWVENIKQIAARLELEGLHGVTFYGGTSDADREIAEQRFNCETADTCKWFCGNPQCGGVGLNLVGQADEYTDCDWIIDYSYDWSWIKRKQGWGRNRRRTTRVPTRVTSMICEDTVEEDIYLSVSAKKNMASNLADLRQMLDRVLAIR